MRRLADARVNRANHLPESFAVRRDRRHIVAAGVQRPIPIPGPMLDRLGDLPFHKDVQPIHHPDRQVPFPDERLVPQRIGCDNRPSEHRPEDHVEDHPAGPSQSGDV